MKVVVDTCVWSLALRRNRVELELPQVLSLRELKRGKRSYAFRFEHRFRVYQLST